MQFLQSMPQVAGVPGQDELAAFGSHPQRLVAGCMTVCGQTNHAVIAEDVEFTLDRFDVLPSLVIARVITEIGLRFRRPLPFLLLNSFFEYRTLFRYPPQ